MLYSVKKDVTEDIIMALNIAVPLSGVGGLSPISPLGVDCWENIKILVSPIGSESSGVSSLDTDDAKQLTPPKSPEDLKIMYNGRDILDLYSNIAPNQKLWTLRYTYLPHNNIEMFLANRSQYHRLGENSHIHDYSLVKCEDCDFQYPVNSTSSFFNQTSVIVSPTTNTAMTYVKSGLRGGSMMTTTVSPISAIKTPITTTASALAAATAAVSTVPSHNFNNFQFQQQKQQQQQQQQPSMNQSYTHNNNKYQTISPNYQNPNHNLLSENLFNNNNNNNFLKKTTTTTLSSTPIKMPLSSSMPISAATSPTSSGYSSSGSSIGSIGKWNQNFNGIINQNNNNNNNNNGNCMKNTSISSSNNNVKSTATNNNFNTFCSFLNSFNNVSNNTTGTANNNNNMLNASNSYSNHINLNNGNNNNNNNNNSIHANHGMLINGQQQPQQNYARMYKYF